MANIIRLKRSSTTAVPTGLKNGEVAYSFLSGTWQSGGERLYIGAGGDLSGDATTLQVVGGKFFTDRLDHQEGVLTANSALVADADKKLDELLVDNLSLNGNTVSTTDVNGNLILSPQGTGLVSIANTWTLPRVDGSANYVLATNGTGAASWVNPALTFAADSGTAAGTNLVGGTVTVSGGEGIDTAISGSTLTISAEDATSSNKGIASFSADFVVSSGNVVLSTVNTNVGSFGSATKIPTFTVNGKGLITAAGEVDVATTLSIAGDTGTDSNGVSLLTDTLTLTGGQSITTTVSDNEVTFDATVATTSALGVASFDSTNFTVTAGAVTAKDITIATDSGNAAATVGETFTFSGGEGIDISATGSTITVAGEDASTTNKGVASFADANFTVTAGAVAAKSITLGSSTLSLGSTTTAIAGVTQLDVDNIRIDGNEISSTDTNGNISLNPAGTGTVALNSARISGLADPVDPQDAATKAYVDGARSGLDVKESVKVATTANITLSNTQTIDGVALSNGDRVLVKNQTTGSQNGIYVVSTGAWSRAEDADTNAEVTAGLFVFVEQGDTNADSGFVLTTDSPLIVGTDALTFVQFSGAGQIIAGAALTKTGNQLDVQVAATGGIEISGDALQLKSTVAGNGLTYTNGVVDVVGTANRITVTADAIDIAATYVGQNTITTVGTVTTGTWSANVVATNYGGTGYSSYASYDLLVGTAQGGLNKLAMGNAGKFLQVNTAGDALVYADFDGGTF